MNRWLRILKHRALDETDTRRAIGPAVLERLRQRVAASERHHSGEIRICVEAGLPLSYLWRGLSARDRAITMFAVRQLLCASASMVSARAAWV